MTDMAELVALPGQPDLDIDVDGMTITAVVVDGRQVLVSMADGFGRFRDANTGRMVNHDPGDPAARVDTCTITLLLPDMPETLFGMYVAGLEEWRDRAAPLRFVGAPGRAFTVIEDRDRYAFMPRRQFPNPDPPEETP